MTRRPDRGVDLISVLADPALTLGLDDAGWSRLIASARNANVLGALAELLAQSEISAGPQSARHLHGARRLSRRQRQSVVWEVHQLQKALGDLGVPIVLLKGAAYVMSQDRIALGRLFGDIDILVPKARIGDVESHLMLNGWISAKSSEYDQRYYRRWMHEIPPMSHMRRGTVLDVHHTILPLTARNAPDPGQIVARSTPVAAPGLASVRVPCPEDLTIHSIVHLVHEGELHNGLRDLRDIDCMLRLFGNVAGFWTRFGTCAAGNDLAQPVLLGLHLAVQVFRTPVPESVFAQLSGSEARKPPAKWLTNAYLKVLRSIGNSEPPWGTATAKWLIYVRSHALRMPPLLLARHLTTKAWMGWRESLREAEKT